MSKRSDWRKSDFPYQVASEVTNHPACIRCGGISGESITRLVDAFDFQFLGAPGHCDQVGIDRLYLLVLNRQPFGGGSVWHVIQGPRGPIAFESIHHIEEVVRVCKVTMAFRFDQRVRELLGDPDLEGADQFGGHH